MKLQKYFLLRNLIYKKNIYIYIYFIDFVLVGFLSKFFSEKKKSVFFLPLSYFLIGSHLQYLFILQKYFFFKVVGFLSNFLVKKRSHTLFFFLSYFLMGSQVSFVVFVYIAIIFLFLSYLFILNFFFFVGCHSCVVKNRLVVKIQH